LETVEIAGIDAGELRVFAVAGIAAVVGPFDL